MPLALVVGPPNAGRAGAIRRRFTEVLDRDPVLVVPTRDDADRFERELVEASDVVVGGSVRTFQRLFEDVARSTGLDQAPVLTDAQRGWLVRRAIDDCDLRVLHASASSDGFAPAMDRLLDDLQASGLDPATLETRAAEAEGDGAYERELAAVFAAYVRLRGALGRRDSHSLAAAATAALRTHPDSWERRPVLFYGFDDMTVEQLELVRALGAACDVTVAVTFQEGREALVARAGLLSELRDAGGDVVEELSAESRYTDSAALFSVERSLFERPDPVSELDDGIVLMSAAGELAEAEQIGAEIAHLLACGVAPDDIAVVVRSPERHGPLLGEVLSGLGIPVAVSGGVPFSATATGRALLAALRAARGDGTADDVLAVLRAPGRARPDGVDWLERRLRRDRARSADDALAQWHETTGWEPFEIADLRDADPVDLASVTGRIARRIAQHPHHRAAPRAERDASLELRAAAVVSESLAQIAELGTLPETLDEIAAILEDVVVPLWRGPADGTVRVLSPYEIRARRVRDLFVASLQEGEFPMHQAGDPLLSDDRRRELGLPERQDPANEERYLFHACVSRPSECLYLSWRDSDDDGQTLPPSPFLADVLDLLPDDVAVRRRGLERVTFDPRDAPSADELARSLAELGGRGEAADLAEGLELAEPVAAAVSGRLRDAASRINGPPGPLTQSSVIESLGERRLYGASTLERYAECSYRWFVDHELQPQSIEPTPEPLTQGGIVHAVLERLYREPPGPDGVPTPASLRAWAERAGELLTEVADERGAPRDALERVGRRRMQVLIERYLAREAESETPLRPDPELLEASFGDGDRDQRPPLDLGGFALHGQIDRVDVSADGRAALIRDYKVSRSVTKRSELEEKGKLQLQLYMTALREQWEIEPVGGVYIPLAATDSPKPRGLLSKDATDGLIDAKSFTNTDFVDPEEFDSALADARARAAEIVGRMRRGAIDRDPIDDRCPTYCRFQPICRRERAVAPEPEDEAEAEEQ
jgi:ATP-dependent helicase/DNAse subunit B